MAADGVSNRGIADVVDMHYNQVGLLRKRYSELGLAGLVDEERSGRPCVYDHDDVLLLVKMVTEDPPGATTAGRWKRWPGHGRPRGADLGVAELAHLQGVGPQALAGRELDDEPRPRLLGKSG